MDIDLGLIRSILDRGKDGLSDVGDAGVTSDMLVLSEARVALELIKRHVKDHLELPSIDFVEAKLGVVIPEVADSLTVYIQEVLERHKFNLQRGLLKGFGELVREKEIEEAHAAITAYQKTIRDAGLGRSKVESLISYGERVIQDYMAAKEGISGIPTPWSSINEMTQGMNEGELWVIVARLAVGKTWLLLMIAEHAWRMGKKVLIITTEMTSAQLAFRFFALHLKIPYNDFRAGRVSLFREEEMFQSIRGLLDQKRLVVMGAGFRATPENVDDAVATAEPDLILLDGMYLVKGAGRNRQERVANVADEVKQTALRYQRPLVATTQFNREVKTNDLSTGRVENIGITDTIGWNSSVVLAALQTDDMHHDRVMVLRPNKVREGAIKKDVTIQFDLDRMAYSEIGVMGGQEFQDRDFNRRDSGSSEGGGSNGIPF